TPLREVCTRARGEFLREIAAMGPPCGRTHPTLGKFRWIFAATLLLMYRRNPTPVSRIAILRRCESAALSDPLEQGHEGLERAAVRGMDQPEGVPPGLVEHRLLLGKREEPPLPVIRAHPRRADAAERGVLLREMPHAVVDRHAARKGFVQNAIAMRRVAAV